jgi:hypothetical protein
MTYPTQNTPPTGRPHRKLAMLAENARSHFEKLAWRVNAALATIAGRLRGTASVESRDFDRLSLHLGQLSPATLADLRSAIMAASIAEFSTADHLDGYTFNPDDDAVAKIFNAGYRFRRLEGPQIRQIGRAMAELAPAITRRLGSGWRIINLKSWSIRSNTVQKGPNAWHMDGFPVGTYKLMLYLTPISAVAGTTEVKMADGGSKVLEGEAGTYLLFDPSTLWHRGVAPSDPTIERTHIEITLMRAVATDCRLADGGLNSAYPRLPWTRRRIRTS